MANECPICEKRSTMGRQYKKLISRYNPSPKKRKYPNLQWVTIPLDVKHKKFKEFAGKRIKACAKCIKTLNKSN